MTNRRFENRVAIISGASSGIGLATAKLIASGGGIVVLASTNLAKLLRAEEEVRKAGAKASWICVCDVSNSRQVNATVEGTMDRYGRFDILVNSAGIMIFKSIEDHSEEDWNKTLGIDLLGSFFFIQQAFKHMQRGGSIINVASIHAIETTPLVSAYAASKAALLSLTRSAAVEGKEKGIRVNAVLPGAIDTPMLKQNPNIKSGTERLKESDIGRPEDVASAIAYLASDEAKFIQGASLRVDGGRLAQL